MMDNKPRKPRTWNTPLNQAEQSALRITAARATRHSGEHLSNALAAADRLAAKLSDEERSERRWRFEAGHSKTLRRLGRLDRK